MLIFLSNNLNSKLKIAILEKSSDHLMQYIPICCLFKTNKFQR